MNPSAIDNEQFYFAFEQKFRVGGHQANVQLEVYRPFVKAMTAAQPTPSALDLGCGRGEWLAVLGDAGFAARGVDTDPVMLAACRDKGLNVNEEDAGACLKNLPDASVDLISAFHLVEHLPFDQQQLLVREAHRVLRPGGLLMLETPNPENLIVGTANFYLDPTHIKPIPAQLLEFLPEYYGFSRVRSFRLNQRAESDTDYPELFSVLNGVGPDLAVVAQKQADVDFFAGFDDAFAAGSGADLAHLSEKYDQRLQLNFQRADARVRQFADEVRGHLDALRAGLENKFQQQEYQQQERQQLLLSGLHDQHLRLSREIQDVSRLWLEQFQATQTYRQERDQLAGKLHAQQQQLQAQQQQLQAQEQQLQAQEQQLQAQQQQLQAQQQQLQAQQQQLQNFIFSTSWRLTAPVRGCGRVLRTLKAQMAGRTLSSAKDPGARAQGGVTSQGDSAAQDRPPDRTPPTEVIRPQGNEPGHSADDRNARR